MDAMGAILDFRSERFLLFFLSISHPDASYQISSQLAFCFRRRRKKQIFKMAAMVAILDIRSWTLLAIFNLQVTLMLLPSFKSIGLSVQEEKRKIDFQDAMAAILDFWSVQFSLLLIYKSPRSCVLPSFKLNGLSVWDKMLKIDFQDGHHSSHLGCPIIRILAIFDLQDILLLPTKF